VPGRPGTIPTNGNNRVGRHNVSHAPHVYEGRE
jgi:hypothetical protein